MENNSLNKANGKKVMSKEELSEYIISAYDSGETMVDIAKYMSARSSISFMMMRKLKFASTIN